MRIHQDVRQLRIVTAAVAILAVGTTEARTADAVEDFYRGKQIRLVIGLDVGGGYDISGRAIARHIGKFIPGNPTIVAENMGGAGGRIAANWLYNVAPKDGSVIGSISQGTPLDQALKQQGIQFDVAEFKWIGNPIVDAGITHTWKASGLATIDDVKTKGGMICGATGATTPATTHPTILNNMLGTKIRIITGYPGTAALNLAMERGEINCIGANTISNIKNQAPQFLLERKVNMVVQWGFEDDPGVSAYAGTHVPLIMELAQTDADRKALTFIGSSVAIGRPLLAPPGVPQDRVNALRRAFEQTMKDPDFLADAKKANMEINSVNGEKLQKIVTDVSRTPADILQRAKQLTENHDLIDLKDKK